MKYSRNYFIVFIIVIFLFQSCSIRKIENNKVIWNNSYEGEVYFHIENVQVSLVNDQKEDQQIIKIIEAAVKSGSINYSIEKNAYYVNFVKMEDEF